MDKSYHTLNESGDIDTAVTSLYINTYIYILIYVYVYIYVRIYSSHITAVFSHRLYPRVSPAVILNTHLTAKLNFETFSCL